MRDEQALRDTARALMGDGRGLIAMDESTGTSDKRFEAAGIPTTEQKRREWRDLIVTTPKLASAISGAILYDETIRQKTLAGVPFAEALAGLGIVPGIKVDAGAKPLALHDGEKITEGLDGLADRLAEYRGMGARFAKWRAVIAIGRSDDGAALPSDACLAANAEALARYAASCQEAGVVPIVEPEVLMDGDHSLTRCAAVTGRALRALFDALDRHGVLLEGTILKPNMVLPGADAGDAGATAAVAEATVTTLRRHVPAAVAGVAFLSGGQSAEKASERLDAMNRMDRDGRVRLPWPLTFSYSRAIQQPALDAWRGDPARVGEAQRLLFHRADCNRAARAGRYDARRDAPVQDSRDAPADAPRDAAT